MDFADQAIRIRHVLVHLRADDDVERAVRKRKHQSVARFVSKLLRAELPVGECDGLRVDVHPAGPPQALAEVMRDDTARTSDVQRRLVLQCFRSEIIAEHRDNLLRLHLSPGEIVQLGMALGVIGLVHELRRGHLLICYTSRTHRQSGSGWSHSQTPAALDSERRYQRMPRAAASIVRSTAIRSRRVATGNTNPSLPGRWDNARAMTASRTPS